MDKSDKSSIPKPAIARPTEFKVHTVPSANLKRKAATSPVKKTRTATARTRPAAAAAPARPTATTTTTRPLASTRRAPAATNTAAPPAKKAKVRTTMLVSHV